MQYFSRLDFEAEEDIKKRAYRDYSRQALAYMLYVCLLRVCPALVLRARLRRDCGWGVRFTVHAILRLYGKRRRSCACRVDHTLTHDVRDDRRSGHNERRDPRRLRLRAAQGDHQESDKRRDRRPKLPGGEFLFPINHKITLSAGLSGY